MKNSTDYMHSGLLELYVLGLAGEEDAAAIAALSVTNPEIRKELELIESALLEYSESQRSPVSATVKPMLLATIDYTSRLQNGEPVTFPPALNENITPADFAPWLNREDMQRPADADDIFVKIIGYTPEVNTAIVWLTTGSPDETHTNERERFLILEGTCEIHVGETQHNMKPGDFFEIPLHINHFVKVTSSFPCKVILQRAAA